MRPHEAFIKLGPLVTPDVFGRIQTGELDGERYYARGAVRLLDRLGGIPLIVDHDDSRRIGTVHELLNLETADGPFMFARATVPDPPAWLEKGIGASFRMFEPLRNHYGWVFAAVAGEVTVCHRMDPAEPLARVAMLSPIEPAKREVFYGGAVIRRPGLGQVLAVR